MSCTGTGSEGELGHVGQAATLDGCDVSLYTKPEEAVRFVQETGVDSLAIACGHCPWGLSQRLYPHH